MITLTVTEGTLNGDGRGNFAIGDLPVLLSPQEFNDYEMERDKLLKNGTHANFNKLYEMIIIDEDNFELKIKFYIQRALSPLVRARFKSKARDPKAYDYQLYLRKKYIVGDVIKLDKVGARRFKIVK